MVKEKVVIHCDKKSFFKGVASFNDSRLWWLKTEGFELSIVAENHHVSSISTNNEKGCLFVPSVAHKVVRHFAVLNWINLRVSGV